MMPNCIHGVGSLGAEPYVHLPGAEGTRILTPTLPRAVSPAMPFAGEARRAPPRAASPLSPIVPRASPPDLAR